MLIATKQALHAESHYVECHYAECRYAECRGTSCGAKCFPLPVYGSVDVKFLCFLTDLQHISEPDHIVRVEAEISGQSYTTFYGCNLPTWHKKLKC